MAQSQVKICNMALSHLGMKEISSITANNPSAEACNTFWEPCREEVFAAHRWAWATAIRLLAEVELDEENPIWEYIYGYPSNVARVWAVFNEGTVTYKNNQEYEIIYDPDSNQKVICSDLDEAYAETTYIVEDVTLWDHQFIMAFSYKLAAAICVRLTGDAAKAEGLIGLYNAMLNDAKRVGAVEKKKKPDQESGYVNARG